MGPAVCSLSVASRDPTYYGLDEAELSRRRELSRYVRDQVFLSIASSFFLLPSPLL
jgi:hypothetical protein